jgi:hypothetical protein
MIDAKDLLKPGALVLGVATAAALGFAAGFIVARDPALLRRLARAVAGGVERVSIAVAESREEIADLWAEVREDARHEAEERAFAEAVGDGDSPTAPAAASTPAAAEAPANVSGPARRRMRRPRASAPETTKH